MIYQDADVIPMKVSEHAMQESNTERQAELLVGMMCRSVPSRVMKRFCEMTGADYEKIVELGSVDRERRGGKKKGRKLKLTPDMVRAIRASDKSNREEARLNSVNERTIRDVRSGRCYAWVTDEGDSDDNRNR